MPNPPTRHPTVAGEKVTDTLTPREVRLCREAFIAGIVVIRGNEEIREWMQNLAGDRYPMPMVEVPQVVKVGHNEFRVIDGALQCRDERYKGTWPGTMLNAEETAVVRDLLNAPTITVPADSPEAANG